MATLEQLKKELEEINNQIEDYDIDDFTGFTQQAKAIGGT